MKKILIFTGAGVSAESGVATFRDFKTGLWHNYSIEDVATPSGWKKNRELVLDFYNQRRAQLKEVEANLAHQVIAQLEDFFDVTVVTQNVDNLHERAGSKNILHLHGNLTQARSTLDSGLIYDWVEDIKIGDKCEKGSQLRPHIVWFSEDLDQEIVNEARNAAQDADVCIIVGTSMQVWPANTIPFNTRESTKIYYVDPGEIDFEISYYRQAYFTHIKEPATIGMMELFNQLVYENENN